LRDWASSGERAPQHSATVAAVNIRRQALRYIEFSSIVMVRLGLPKMCAELVSHQ
jgi:hypothetical protein